MRKRRRHNNNSDNPIRNLEQNMLTQDAFSNSVSRQGAFQNSAIEATTYPITRLTRNYNLMNSLYRSHWVASRIIDTIPEHMTKNWLKINSELSPEQLTKYSQTEKKTKIKYSLTHGLKWGSLYGGAACVMLIDGHQDMLDEPLDHDSIMPGSFKGLMVVDRWSGIYPGPGLIKDISSPDRGFPEYYRVMNDADKSVTEIHHSRILRFQGKELPLFEKQAEQYWGCSKIEDVFDELKKRDNTSWNIAGLMFLANLRTLQMDGMEQVLGVGNKKAQANLYNTVKAQNALWNNFGMYVMGKEDKITNFQYSFAGVAEVYETFMLDISGAAQIPMLILFGRCPAGMNASGEGDLQNFYNTVEQKQENDLRPQYEKLMPVLAMSTWGEIPDDLEAEFNPIQTPTAEEVSKLVKEEISGIVEAYQADIITQKTAVKELKQMSETTGMFTNITNENVDAASDEFQGASIINGLSEIPGLENNPEEDPGKRKKFEKPEENPEGQAKLDPHKKSKRFVAEYKKSNGDKVPSHWV